MYLITENISSVFLKKSEKKFFWPFLVPFNMQENTLKNNKMQFRSKSQASFLKAYIYII